MNKRLLYLAGTIAVIAVILVAVQQARPAPPAETAEPTALDQGRSTQPKITWSLPSLDVTLSPGESTSRDLVFQSDQRLKKAIIEPVPELAPFLTVQPSTFATVPANTSQAVHLTFAISPNTKYGSYVGTIHLRVGTQTLPQTFKLSLNVWQTFSSPNSPISFKYPSLPANPTFGAKQK